MTKAASLRERNHSMLKHSSRSLPLKLSLVPFCQGLPGSIRPICHPPQPMRSKHCRRRCVARRLRTTLLGGAKPFKASRASAGLLSLQDHGKPPSRFATSNNKLSTTSGQLHTVVSSAYQDGRQCPEVIHMSSSRTETDSFGPIEVPSDALWGGQTERSLRFFKIGQQRMPLEVVHALARVVHEVRATSYCGLIGLSGWQAVSGGDPHVLEPHGD